MATASFSPRGGYRERPLSADATAEDVQRLREKLLQSLNNTEQDLLSANTIARNSCKLVEEQNEQLVRIEKTVQSVGDGLERANATLKKMKMFRSPFGFSGKAKKYAYIFESKYGVADWSGPLRKRRRLYPVSNTLRSRVFRGFYN